MKTAQKDTKLKILKPVVRQKKRFIQIQINSDKKFDFETLSKYLTRELMYFIGAIDYGKAGIWFIKDKFNEKTQSFVLKVSTKTKDKLLATISLITKINETPVKLSPTKVASTLKGLNKENKKPTKKKK